MEYEAISPICGVKVKLDLARKLGDEERETLRALFAKHLLIVVEVADLTDEQQMDFTGTFGRLIPTARGSDLGIYVSNKRDDGYLGSYELEWHTDGSFLVEPFGGGSLYALDVEPHRSSTRFVNASAVLDRLPPKLYERIRYLQVVNTMETTTKLGQRVAMSGSNLVASAHPIIATHPVSGIRFLTPNPYQSDCIIGLDPEQSRELLEELYSYLYDPEYVVEHSWKNGDLVLWDNLALHHARSDISALGTRTLRRFTFGPASMNEQVPAEQKKIMESTFSARRGEDAYRVEKSLEKSSM